MTINIANNDPRINYTATAGQTVFTVPFEFFDNTDIKVYIEGTLKTITTHYTVSGGNGSTGSVTLTAGATLNDEVTLVRDVPLERTTDLTSSYNAASLDAQLDRIVAEIADLDDRVSRTIQINDYELASGLLLPALDSRKGKTIQFNTSSGALEVGPTGADLTAIGSVTSEIATLAGISSNITTVAGSNAQVVAVGNAMTSITAINSALTNINTVAGGIANINLVGGSIADVNDVADSLGEISAVQAKLTNIDTVAIASTNIGTVAGSISQVNSVASKIADVTGVNNNISAITTANANATNVNLVANNIDDVNDVGTVITKVTTVADNIASVNTVAPKVTEISTVSANIGNINTVATNMSSITAASSSAADALASKNAAATSATNAANSATASASSATAAAASASSITGAETNAANSATAAATSATAAQTAKTAAETALDEFTDIYLGSKSVAPTVDNDGNALATGSIYWNSGVDQLYIWDGSAWDDAAFTASGAVTSFNTRTGAVTLSSADVTNAAGLLTTGGTMTGDLSFGDNDKAKFGAGSDLQIYHTGSTSYISDIGSGDLLIQGSSLIRLTNTSGANYFQGTDGGQVQLYYGGATKLTTTSTGIAVTGTVTSDDYHVKTGGHIEFDFNGSSTHFTGTNSPHIFAGSGGSGAYLAGTLNLQSRPTLDRDINLITGATPSKTLTAHGNGDISFYEDTGTTAKFFWDASAESLGIGTSSPAEELDISADAPSIQLSSTNASGRNYGLQSQNSGKFAFYDGTAGLNRLVIDSSGQVGIGTTSPNASLEVLKSGGGKIRISETAAKYVEIIGYAEGSANGSTMAFHTNQAGTSTSTERMRIDSSGNVGIGTDSPSRRLHVKDSGSFVATFEGGTNAYTSWTNSTGTAGYIGSANGLGSGGITDLAVRSENNLIFLTNAGSERMRIDSSGNLLVGKSSANATDVGIVANANGRLYATASGDSSIFNRTSSDGGIVEFRKDGTAVGSIYSGHGGTQVGIGTNTTGITFNPSTRSMMPANPSSTNPQLDATLDIGFSSVRWKDLYLSGGVYLGGTGSANKLDDYEEGTWTPTTNGTNPTVQKATYTKIGNRVHISLYLTDLSNSTGSQIHGLPFTPSSQTYAPTRYHSNRTDYFKYVLRADANSTSLAFLDETDGAVAITTAVTSFVVAQFTYQTDA